MSQSKVKTAVLGLPDECLNLLETAEKTDLFSIEALADDDPERAQRAGRRFEAQVFDDYRQLVVRNPVDLLILASPAYQCHEYIKTVMRKKCSVLKFLPPAVNFERAAELAAIAKKQQVHFIPLNPDRFSESSKQIDRFLEKTGIENIQLIRGTYCTAKPLDQLHDRWLSDPNLAGGGVLLRNCYEMIDQILLRFNIPQQVYSLNTNHAPDRQQRLSITEDIAVVTMKFSDTLMASLVASRAFGPQESSLQIHAKDCSCRITPESCVLCDKFGDILESESWSVSAQQNRMAFLENVAQSLLEPEQNRLYTDENADLKNMAVIEAAYLSARTGMPEEPGRILQMVTSEPTHFWTSATKRFV